MVRTRKESSLKQRGELLNVLQTRFENNMSRHEGLEWGKIKAKLQTGTEKLWTLDGMERTGGEPDVVGHDKRTDEYIFFDCSLESPKVRRSLCYDRKALDSRKENKPKGNAIGMAQAMGTELLTEDQYQELQKFRHEDFELAQIACRCTGTRWRDFWGSPLRPSLYLSQRGGVLLRRKGIPRFAQSINLNFHLQLSDGARKCRPVLFSL